MSASTQEIVNLRLVGGLTMAQIKRLAKLRERIRKGEVSEG